jgi:uncharacterized integral membrane protein
MTSAATSTPSPAPARHERDDTGQHLVTQEVYLMTAELPQGIPASAEAAATPQDLSHAPMALPARGIKKTRAGELWVAAGFFAVILLLLLIFVMQNTQPVSISYFGVHVDVPLGVAVLMAAVLGVLLVAIPGTWRIIQLRRADRKQRHAAAK